MTETTRSVAIQPVTLTTLLTSRFSRLLLSLALSLALVAPTQAMAWRSKSDKVGGERISSSDVPLSKAPNIDAAAGILMTSDGRELWSRRGDKSRAMASTTKIMTALLAIEHGKLKKKVKISKKASKVPYGLGLHKGEKLKARRLLELAMVASSNDAAYALGEHVAGSEKAFVKKMNKRARELGLEDTHFANAHGLDAPGHYSSPEDLAVLAQEAMKHDEFKRAVKMKKVKLPKHKGRKSRKFKSTDKLLGDYQGLRGVKTGYTNDAGFSFVGQAKRNGITLTAVILGAKSGNSRFTQTARLLDWGFKNVKVRQLTSAGSIVGQVPVAANPGLTVPVRIDKTKTRKVFKLDGKLERKASLAPQVALPVFEGQPLGEYEVRQGDKVLAKMPALAATALSSEEGTVGAVPVTDYIDRTVTARTVAIDEQPKFDPEVPVDQRVELEPKVTAPVAMGEPLGEITYEQEGKVIARVPVVAGESIQTPSFFENLRIALKRGWLELVGGSPMAQLEVVTS